MLGAASSEENRAVANGALKVEIDPTRDTGTCVSAQKMVCAATHNCSEYGHRCTQERELTGVDGGFT